MYKFWGEHMFPLLLGMNLRVELLSHMVTQLNFFQEGDILTGNFQYVEIYFLQVNYVQTLIL